MSTIAVRHQTEPLSEINTTPLIDVLLVLLILVVITIPPAVHSLPVDLPIHLQILARRQRVLQTGFRYNRVGTSFPQLRYSRTAVWSHSIALVVEWVLRVRSLTLPRLAATGNVT